MSTATQPESSQEKQKRMFQKVELLIRAGEDLPHLFGEGKTIVLAHGCPPFTLIVATKRQRKGGENSSSVPYYVRLPEWPTLQCDDGEVASRVVDLFNLFQGKKVQSVPDPGTLLRGMQDLVNGRETPSARECTKLLVSAVGAEWKKTLARQVLGFLYPSLH